MHINEAIQKQVCIQCADIKQRDKVQKLLELEGFELLYAIDDGLFVEIISYCEYSLERDYKGFPLITATDFLNSNSK